MAPNVPNALHTSEPNSQLVPHYPRAYLLIFSNVENQPGLIHLKSRKITLSSISENLIANTTALSRRQTFNQTRQRKKPRSKLIGSLLQQDRSWPATCVCIESCDRALGGMLPNIRRCLVVDIGEAAAPKPDLNVVRHDRALGTGRILGIE